MPYNQHSRAGTNAGIIRAALSYSFYFVLLRRNNLLSPDNLGFPCLRQVLLYTHAQILSSLLEIGFQFYKTTAKSRRASLGSDALECLKKEEHHDVSSQSSRKVSQDHTKVQAYIEMST